MKKAVKEITKKQIILAVAAFALTGCAGKGEEDREEVLLEDLRHSIEHSMESSVEPSMEPSDAALTDREDKEETEAPPAETETGEEREARLSACVTALENLYFDQVLPNGQECGYQPGANSDITSNSFALYDIDFDGKDELILCYWTTYTAGQVTAVYSYESEAGALREEFAAYPALRFYDNGVIEADDSHNHGMASDGAFWPYRLFQYDRERDVYEETANVDAWSRTFREEDYDGNPFPEETDADGDGLVYYIMPGGTYELKDPVDGEEYERWRESYRKDASLTEIPYVSLTLENIYAISDFCLDLTGNN